MEPVGRPQPMLPELTRRCGVSSNSDAWAVAPFSVHRAGGRLSAQGARAVAGVMVVAPSREVQVSGPGEISPICQPYWLGGTLYDEAVPAGERGESCQHCPV